MDTLKSAIRSTLRPLAAWGRKLLKTPAPPVSIEWHTIEAGPARGCQLRLPTISTMTDRICAGTYEPICTSIMEALVRPDSVCFDVGGHYGYFTLVMARLASSGQVQTFEPVPRLAERIADAAVRSGLSHVAVHAVAVADIEGQATLHFTEELNHDSMAYLEECGGIDAESAHEHYPTFESLTVPVVRLDSFQDRHPDFLKIDAEGAEAAILKGATQILEQPQVRLLMEIHGIEEALECAKLLRTFGYRALRLAPQQTTMPVLWVRTEDEQALNAVATVLGHTPQVLFQ